MIIRNFLKSEFEPLENCHDGIGTLKNVTVFNKEDFKTNISFINYTVLPPETSAGIHQHKDDEEVYIILEGSGIMTVDGESRSVTKGDVIINRPFGSHGLLNNSKEEMKILVFEVKK